MAFKTRHQAKAGAGEPPRCPQCGAALSARLLVVNDEGESETLLLFDCPKGDYHTTVTRADLVRVLTVAVREQLRHPYP